MTFKVSATVIAVNNSGGCELGVARTMTLSFEPSFKRQAARVILYCVIDDNDDIASVANRYFIGYSETHGKDSSSVHQWLTVILTLS